MDNFDLRKYLAEGRLFEELSPEISPEEFIEDMIDNLNESSNPIVSNYIKPAIISLITLPFVGINYLISTIYGDSLVKDIKALRKYYQNYKMKKEIDEEQVKSLIQSISNSLEDLSTGKSKFMKSFIKKLQNANGDKNELLKLEKNIKKIFEKYNIKTPKELEKISLPFNDFPGYGPRFINDPDY